MSTFRFARSNGTLWCMLFVLSAPWTWAAVPTVVEEEASDVEQVSEEPRSGKPYDLSRMEAFSWVILQFKQEYVDPSRIHPEAMMKRALQYVERRASEVQINLVEKPVSEAQPDQKVLTAEVQVGAKRQEFKVGKPNTIWEMNYSLRPVFKFIAENLEPATDAKEVEFAAINGMLATLDPHSNLLPPDLYREMRLKTIGEFGGLGIRITIRKGALTIISPLPDTPAARMGLRAMDQIVRIGDQSTVNMPLDEAVNLLRGKPGSKVTIWVMRSGWSEPHKYVMGRETIMVRSIEAKLLDQRIGYIQIQDFTKNTAGDLLRNLNEMKREAKGLKGLVLDLRNNAGGLLKAAVESADLFLKSGVIVATVSYSEDATPEHREQKNREEQRASGNAVEQDMPMVVLINSGSASASEILAGALKNLDRALLLGDQTFGKGSVQTLNDRVPEAVDGACLKLTVFEYLIPGDVSIQEVGVTPDVQLVPMMLDKDNVQAFAQLERFREQNIPAHLKMHNTNVLKPAEVLHYVMDIPEKKKTATGEDEEPPLEEPGFKEDFEIRLAKEFLLHVQSAKGTAMLDEGATFLREAQAREQKKMAEQLSKIGVDWSAGSGSGAKGEVQFKLVGEGVDAEGRAQADKNVRLQLTVRNAGSAPFYRLRAETACKNLLFKQREFLFGRVNPGQSKTWEVPIKIPRGAMRRTDDLRFTFFCEGDQPPPRLETTISTVSLSHPSFGFSWRVLDPEGNGDGLIEPGEKVDLELTVYNKGAGKAFDAKALLKNEAGKDLFLEAGKGRIVLKDIAPGQSRSQSFSFKVPQGCSREELPVELTIWDSALGTTQVADVKLPVMRRPNSKPRVLSQGLSVVGARAEVRGGADAKAPLVAFAKKGSTWIADRQEGPWYRLAGKGAPFGWIHQQEVKPAPVAGPGNASALLPFCQFTPPRVELEPLPSYLQQGSSVVLKGKVVDEDQDLRDVAVWVNNDKVFLESGSESGNLRAMNLEVPLILEPGPNLLTVVAREGSKYSSQQTILVTRPGGLDYQKKTDDLGEEDNADLFE